MKRILVLAALIASISMLGISCSKKEAGKHTEAPLNDSPAIEVSVSKIIAKDYADTYEAVGTVQSGSRSVLSPRVMGYIRETLVSEGDHVYIGQLLAVIDSREIEAQVQQAEAGVMEAQRAIAEVDDGIAAAQFGLESAQANLELAEKTYNRFDKLRQENSVSAQEFDQVAAQKRSAEAETARVKKSIQALYAKRRQVESKIAQAKSAAKQVSIMRDFAYVRAPFNGVVVQKTASTGQLAAPGSPLFIIEDNTNYRLEAQVDEDFIKDIKMGQNTDVTINAIDKGKLTGKITGIVPSVDSSSRTFTVKISLPKSDELRSGLYGKARFDRGVRKIIAVSPSVVVTRGQIVGVYIVSDGRASFRLVKTGRTMPDGSVEVLSGITAGETVVTSGTDRLTDGRKVVVGK